MDTEQIMFTVFAFMFMALAFYFVFNYQLPTLDRQSKQIDCLNHGFYDYDSSTNSCYELGYDNLQPLDKVMKDNIFGRHCNLDDACRVLRSKLK